MLTKFKIHLRRETTDLSTGFTSFEDKDVEIEAEYAAEAYVKATTQGWFPLGYEIIGEDHQVITTPPPAPQASETSDQATSN